MARLILDENGKRRAFKLNNGRLSVGSGESNALTLSSPDVAEVHAELRIDDGVVTLVPKAGVLPPTVLGRQVTRPTRLSANAEFKIGSALFRLESDAAAAPAPRGPQAASTAVRRGGAAASGVGQGIQHRRRTVSRGIPGWMIFAIIVVVCVLGYFVGKLWMADNAETYDPSERYREAVLAFEQGSTKRASDELDNVDLQRSGPELLQKVAQLRAKLDAAQESAYTAEHNMKGTEWMDDNLKEYVTKYLQGDRATRASARVFIQRCDEFRKEWPTHPELDWVDRYRDRYAKLADLGIPAEYADLEWEVKRLTAGKPRDYVRVFKQIEAFLARASGEQKNSAQALLQEQTVEREAYFLDRMLESQYQWTKKAYGEAVEWLVQLIVGIGDAEMAEQAVEAFLKMQRDDGEPLSERYLESYKRNRPEQFEVLMTHDKMRAAAKKAGIL